MEMTDAKVVEKKIYEEGKKHDDYASKATGNAGLTLGIIGTALGAAPIGLPVSDTRFVDADPFEYAHIGDESSFVPRDGRYVLQVTEELREVLYLDEAKLVIVDHPAGTEVHSTSKLVPGKPFPKHELVTLHRRMPLLKAINHESTDVTALLSDVDQRMVSPAKLRAPQMRGPGCVLAFELHAGYEAAATVMQAVKRMTPAVSLGSVDTLIQHPAGLTHRVLNEQTRQSSGIREGLLRLSVGIEDVEDLVADLEQALAKAQIRAVA